MPNRFAAGAAAGAAVAPGGPREWQREAPASVWTGARGPSSRRKHGRVSAPKRPGVVAAVEVPKAGADAAGAPKPNPVVAGGTVGAAPKSEGVDAAAEVAPNSPPKAGVDAAGVAGAPNRLPNAGVGAGAAAAAAAQVGGVGGDNKGW